MLKSNALQLLSEKVSSCTKCDELVEYRVANGYRTVPGSGSPNARIMILGEAPGEMEAIEGLPFVGAAGHLLTSILAAAGLSRDEVYIGNILKCRPPSNRDPSVQEAKNCRGFLDLQIKVINPAWIICFGRIPSVYLLGREPYETIGSLRGKVYDFFGKKVICTYHPSYLLRTPEAKGEVWKDLQPLIFALQNRKGS